MSLARVHTWIAGEILLASDLNAEFNNILTNPASLIAPIANITTRQTFLTGTAQTYTTPANVRQLRIRMRGGGGGGGGTGTTTPGAATAGTASIFNSIQAAGGANAAAGLGGLGGTGGTGTASLRISGMAGQNWALGPPSSGTNLFIYGGAGGGDGGGRAGNSNNGEAAVANTGAGGGGGGITADTLANIASSWNISGGGGEGEYVELIINSPAATYTYTVGQGGNGGTAGTSGKIGGPGAAGWISVEELY